MKIFLIVFSLLLFGAGAGPLIYASDGTTGDYMVDIGTKFGRGLENILTSPAEIPCMMAEDIHASGAQGSVTGFGKGILFMCRRILVGVTEIASFIIPMERTIPRVCSAKS